MESRITLNSGKILTIQKMSFGQSSKLLRIILKEAQKAGVKLDDNMLSSGNFLNSDLSDVLKDGQGLLDTVLNSAINLATSEELEKMIFECAARSTWDIKKITPALFDEDEDAISDYFEICFHIVKEHVSPFFKHLSTSLGSIRKMTGKSKNPTQK